MANFSIGDALGSGFTLLKRRPVSVLVWGLTYLIVGVGLQLALFASLLGSDYLALLRNLHPGMATTPPEQAMQMMAPMQAKMMLLQPISILVTLLLQSVLGAAVFRAVLEPRNRGLAYLRLGPREFWLVLVNFVSRVLAGILLIGLAVVGLIVGFALNAVFQSQNLDWATRGAAFAALGIVLFAVFIGICVRFAMAWPMTFAENRFRLFESWELTRGRAWKLFGLGLLIALICMVVIILCEALAAIGVLLAAGGANWSPTAFADLVQNPRQLLTPGFEAGLAVGALIGAYLAGALLAIATAPWATVYRELLPAAKPEPREGGLYVPAPLADDPGPDEHGHADPHADPEGGAHPGAHGEGD